MNSPVKKSQYIKYESTLICHDGVQLFTGLGAKSRRYICLAVPSKSSSEEIFLCTPTLNIDFNNYVYEHIDLYALIKSKNIAKHYIVDLKKLTPKGYVLSEIEHIPEAWLPARAIFSSSHTENFLLPDDLYDGNQKIKEQKISLDGQWDTVDLASLPELFTDNYSFLYALNSFKASSNKAVGKLFQKYPWKGGFSAVGFYKGLYNQIPRPHKLAVNGITKNSPGVLKLSAVESVMIMINSTVTEINKFNNGSHLIYRELRDGMSVRELLGRSIDEVNVDDSDLNFIESRVKALANSMNFQLVNEMHELSGGNWVATGKIFMSYYRRIKQLSEFLDTGKASFLS